MGFAKRCGKRRRDTDCPAVEAVLIERFSWCNSLLTGIKTGNLSEFTGQFRL
jgi:hypothetical protein